MSSLLKKTTKQLKIFLKFVAKIIAEQLLKIGVVALIGLGFLYGLYAPARDFLLELFQLPLAKLPKELLLYHLLLLMLLIVSLTYLAFFIKKKINNKVIYDFIDVGGLSWARNINSSQVGSDPHCPHHHIQLNIDEHYANYYGGDYKKIFSFFCPLCNEFVKKDVSGAKLEIWREIANNMVHAKYYGYLRKSKH